MAYPEVLEDIKKCIALDVPGKVPIFAIRNQDNSLYRPGPNILQE